MSRQQIDEATDAGFALVKSGPFIVRLTWHEKQVWAWRIVVFGGKMPKLDNSELSSGGPADNRQQTEQAARRLLK